MPPTKTRASRAPRMPEPQPVASGRMLPFLEALFAFHGKDMRDHAKDLASVPSDGPIPMWFDWSDYVKLIQRLGTSCGGSEGIARAMRGVPNEAYAEFRAAKGFFPNPVDFFAFYTHQIMPSVTPGCVARVELLGAQRLRVRYAVHPATAPSDYFFAGTVTLLELFPTHFDLPEAKVSVVGQGPLHIEIVAQFPEVDASDPWAGFLRPRPAARLALTPREREVLALVTLGYTNREAARSLGTAPSTVRNQLSSIMEKMQAVNRTELAVRARAEGIVKG